MNDKILLIDANRNRADSIEELLSDESYTVLKAAHPSEAPNLASEPIDLVICDLSSGQEAAFDLLRDWGSRAIAPRFILLLESGDVESAVEGMKLGAVDCLVKPVDGQQLRQLVLQTAASGVNSRTQSVNSSSGNGPTVRGGKGTQELAIPEGTSLEDLERAAVQKALEQHHGNRTHAARELGISVRTLQRKLKAWRLPLLTFPHYSSTPESMSPLSQ
jgi:DNA-binding NtrC family response regulator